MTISGATRLAAVIGSPIRHSLSPAIQNAAFAAAGLDWTFLAFDVAPGDAPRALDAMRVFDLAGMSVTMPHKSDVARAIERCSPAATALGAVNCVVPTGDGALVGENTDGAGFLDTLRIDEDWDPAGRRCIVLGAGGAARAVVLALGEAGAATVTVVNRTADRAEAAAALAGAVGRVGPVEAAADAELVVNATPIGMGGDDRSPVAEMLLGAGQVVVDLVYQPTVTPLLAAATQRGARAVGGIGMLVHQAAHAFRLWTGDEPPVAAMADAARGAIAAR